MPQHVASHITGLYPAVSGLLLRQADQEDPQAVLSAPAVDPGNCSFLPGLCAPAPHRELRLCLEVLYYSLFSVSGHEPNHTI